MNSFILGLCLGILICIIVAIIYVKIRYFGVLRVDTSDPEEPPYLFFEVSKSMDAILKKERFVVLKILPKNYVSHDKH